MSSATGAEKRLAMLERLIEGGSTDPFHHYAHATELRSLGRFEAALDGYRGVRDRFPEYLPTYLMAGQVAEELGRVDEARGFFEAGLSLASKTGESHARAELEAALAAL